METLEIKTEEPRKIFVKKEFFEQILSGNKTAEARPLADFVSLPIPGEKIIFECSIGQAEVIIIAIETYKNFKDLKDQTKDVSKFGRGITPTNTSFIWSKLYPNYNNEPVVVINFKKNDYSRH